MKNKIVTQNNYFSLSVRVGIINVKLDLNCKIAREIEDTNFDTNINEIKQEIELIKHN